MSLRGFDKMIGGEGILRAAIGGALENVVLK